MVHNHQMKRDDNGENHNLNDRCGRQLLDKEIHIAEANFTAIERTVLDVARHFWQTFAIPQTHSWLRALQISWQHSNFKDGGELGLSILAAVQAMRLSRSSCFHFNNPTCADCAVIITEHERHFMQIFRAVRDGDPGLARTHAMILCEGNDTGALIDRMTDLVTVACGPNQALAEQARPGSLIAEG